MEKDHRQPDGLAHGHQPDRPVILELENMGNDICKPEDIGIIVDCLLQYTGISDPKQEQKQ